MINIYMKDEYFYMFKQAIVDTEKETGHELPHNIEVYLTTLLATYTKNNDFLPSKTFVETLYEINSKKSAKDLGDSCLFVTGVFPSYGKERGLSRSYFQGIGSMSYSIAANYTENEIFSNLSTHFKFLSEFIAIVTKKYE